jgi:hypothetical protein
MRLMRISLMRQLFGVADSYVPLRAPSSTSLSEVYATSSTPTTYQHSMLGWIDVPSSGEDRGEFADEHLFQVPYETVSHLC